MVQDEVAVEAVVQQKQRIAKLTSHKNASFLKKRRRKARKPWDYDAWNDIDSSCCWSKQSLTRLSYLGYAYTSKLSLCGWQSGLSFAAVLWCKLSSCKLTAILLCLDAQASAHGYMETHLIAFLWQDTLRLLLRCLCQLQTNLRVPQKNGGSRGGRFKGCEWPLGQELNPCQHLSKPFPARVERQ